MTGWTEATLRAAASWKAFKEGKAFFEGGTVAEALAGQTGWRGAVRCGKRLFRVQVAVKSATDLETRCSCPENQATGEICGHAVAVGLAALVGGITAPAAEAVVSQPASPGVTSIPWQILLPLNWRDALARGKFAVTLATSAAREISPADDRLNAWLACERVASKEILSLNLAGSRVATFLEAVADHPRLSAGKDRFLITIRAGERFRLDDATLLGDHIRLVPAADSGNWVELGGAFWQMAPDSLTRLGEGRIPADLASALGEISRGQPVEVPTERFFNHLDSWQEWVAFPAECWLESLHFLPAPAVLELSLEGSLQHLDARLQVNYGHAPAVSPGLGTIDGLPRLLDQRCEIRDLATEERATARLAKAGFQPVDYSSGRWSLRGESAILDFLTRTLPLLRSQWSVAVGDRLAQLLKRVTLVSPKIDILDAGEDWLRFDLAFQSDDGSVVPASEVRRLLRSGKGSGKTAGGRQLVISDDLAELIDPLFADLDLSQENGGYLASARAGEVVREIRNKLSKSNTSNDLHESLPFVNPATLAADLRPYQRHGAGWLLDRVERFGGALLADDMGLGKTLQAIALIECLLAQACGGFGLGFGGCDDLAVGELAGGVCAFCAGSAGAHPARGGPGCGARTNRSRRCDPHQLWHLGARFGLAPATRLPGGGGG